MQTFTVPYIIPPFAKHFHVHCHVMPLTEEANYRAEKLQGRITPCRKTKEVRLAPAAASGKDLTTKCISNRDNYREKLSPPPAHPHFLLVVPLGRFLFSHKSLSIYTFVPSFLPSFFRTSRAPLSRETEDCLAVLSIQHSVK